ncbi:2OG-Fe(II) oxygenase [[Leptolyngbya] sp. PCC 7376]|uniref:2OG-Fe(II) oxygenase n=1 Tax=[Leptolyngbya] sp. PCC 7376 TaxID=111781 RepID=UPI00029F31D6|nr:2OG-Fe(II) oxygenase [[Leptolyngbya] sp. PCC 7376]AFY39603.1 2OG-Fe(II) oxygenase [[Leptolyngbya] sp. PCC 7376]
MSLLTTQSKPTSTQTRFLKGDSVIIPDFLPPEKYYEILNFTLTCQSLFRASSTVTQETNYRQSLVAFSYDFPVIYEWMKCSILKHFPRICHQLQRPYFRMSQIEMQMTAHNHNNFYKLHNDSGSEDTYTRELTYVYYFYREPQAFSGGELRLYDTTLKGKHPLSQTQFQEVQPQNNSIVFFNSDCQHEVMPVICPSEQFPDSRFTINGWLRH